MVSFPWQPRGRGIGRALLATLVADSEDNGSWTLQAGIFPGNEASVSLRRHAGFRVVGTRGRLGLMTYGPMAGRLRHVLLLERRSGLIGGRRDD